MDLYTLIILSCSLVQPYGCVEVQRIETPMPMKECNQTLGRTTLGTNDLPGRYLFAVCRLTHKGKTP